MYVLASLLGLCTNTACPYRHVKVNSNAPVCEDFLKGYCADGDEVFIISLELYRCLLFFCTLHRRVGRHMNSYGDSMELASIGFLANNILYQN